MLEPSVAFIHLYVSVTQEMSFRNSKIFLYIFMLFMPLHLLWREYSQKYLQLDPIFKFFIRNIVFYYFSLQRNVWPSLYVSQLYGKIHKTRQRNKLPRCISILGEEKPYGSHHLCWSWVCGCNANHYFPHRLQVNPEIYGILDTSSDKFSCDEHRWHIGP